MKLPRKLELDELVRKAESLRERYDELRGHL